MAFLTPLSLEVATLFGPHLLQDKIHSTATTGTRRTKLTSALDGKCIWCIREVREPEKMAALKQFVEEQVVQVPDALNLYILAADRAAVLGLVRDESESSWAHLETQQAIENHYTHCQTNACLTTNQIARELRGIRNYLNKQLEKQLPSEQGPLGNSRLCGQYQTVCNLETKFQARVLEMIARVKENTNRVGLSSLVKSEAPQKDPGSKCEQVDAAHTCSDSIATSQLPLDKSTAQGALRDILFEYVEPCRPSPTARQSAVQPRLDEFARGEAFANIALRERLGQLEHFQTCSVRGLSRKRCFCDSTPNGTPCHFHLSKKFCEMIAQRLPEALMTALPSNHSQFQDGIKQILNLRAGPIKIHTKFGSNVIFGYRLKRSRENSNDEVSPPAYVCPSHRV